jgi:hypothetical protein
VVVVVNIILDDDDEGAKAKVVDEARAAIAITTAVTVRTDGK